MPTSRHRKNHKQKANARKIAAVNRKRQIDNLNKSLAEAIAASQKQQNDPIMGPTISLTPTPQDENNLPSWAILNGNLTAEILCLSPQRIASTIT